MGSKTPQPSNPLFVRGTDSYLALFLTSQVDWFFQKELDQLNPQGQRTHEFDWRWGQDMGPGAARFAPSVSQATVRLLLAKLREFYIKNQAHTAKVKYESEPVP